MSIDTINRLFQRAEWMDDGACRGLPRETLDRLFFPSTGQGNKIQMRQARQFCDNCPVKAECLDYALEHFEWGVWGGTSEKQRRNMRRVLSGKPDTINHGTIAGHRQHARRGVPMCEPCREANREHKAKYEGAA